MKNVTKAVAMFLYRFSGLQYVVSEIESFVFRYSLRVRMVPVSYKLFILTLGVLIGGSSVFVNYEYPKMVENIDPLPKSKNFQEWTFENPPLVKTVEAKAPIIEETKENTIEYLADYIWLKESTRGKNNFSKCESIGKINGIGYAIPGNGEYVCFDSHEEEMQVLKGWIVYRKALGWSELKMLCTYSGNNYDECTK